MVCIDSSLCITKQEISVKTNSRSGYHSILLQNHFSYSSSVNKHTTNESLNIFGMCMKILFTFSHKYRSHIYSSSYLNTTHFHGHMFSDFDIISRNNYFIDHVPSYEFDRCMDVYCFLQSEGVC